MGNQYKIIAEAVVSVKTLLEKDDSAWGVEKYRRTAHIMSHHCMLSPGLQHCS